MKQLVEDRFAEPARGRVHVHATRHRRSAECITRGWITVDGEEIFEASTGRARRQEMRRYNPGWSKRMGHKQLDIEEVEEIAGWDFSWQLFTYLNMKPAQALKSESPLLQAMAVLDERTGKRTLAKIEGTMLHPLVERLLKLRTGESSKDSGVTAQEK